jgi:phosphoribosylaminoimidazole-succinocarboxamide synthase
MTRATTSPGQRASALRAALSSTLFEVGHPAPSHRGKVRDVYVRGDELLLVATDRVSAFDVVLGTLPLKGAMLTHQSAFWLARAASVCPTHLLAREAPQVLRCRRAQALPVELVVRGYLAGSLLREDKAHRGHSYGLRLDPNQAAYSAFPTPIVTPTTKEAVGQHDRPCSLADLVASGAASQAQMDACVEHALALFAMGQAHAQAQGLLLVDTKYEFGVVNGVVILIDEVHTADSSRFWLASSHAHALATGSAPHMLDKEHLRRWLISEGFQGEGTPPALPDDVRVDVSSRYWELTETLLGEPFTAPAPTPVDGVVSRFVSQLE